MIRNLKILTELFSLLYCMAELYGRKIRLSIYVVVLAIVDMFIMSAIDDYGFPQSFRSIVHVCIFLYALSYYGEGIKRTLVNYFLAAVIMSSMQLITLIPVYLIYYKKYGEGVITELIANVLSILFIVLTSYKIHLYKLSDFFLKRNKLVTGISLLVLIVMGMNFYQMQDIRHMYGEVNMQFIFFIFIFAFIIYEWQKSQMDAEKKKTQLEMNDLYYDAYDKLIALIRERQHDMKTHISTILSMVYTIDNYDELVAKQTEYCNQVIDQNEKTRLALAVENPLIAGFLHSVIQDAEKNDIKLDYHINIDETTSVLPEYELIDMASVLVYNAIEALSANDSQNKEVQTKKIYVSMKETGESMELIVANTSPYLEENITESFFETGYSSKGKGRGIGLSKLKRMVHEKTGDIIVSNEKYDDENYIQFCIIIPAKAKGGK